jgi:glucose-6-phosphate isomerase
MAEWWKQLFGESEGKEGKGLFPASVAYTTDLHSLGQYLQEGRRNLFETFLTVDTPRSDLPLPPAQNADGLDYLEGRPLSEINREAHRSTAFAHLEGGVPNMTIALPALTPGILGELIYMFETAVALSGYAIGVNPFDQPGVEAYKRNMFALLGKPGFDELRSSLEDRMGGHAPHLVD